MKKKITNYELVQILNAAKEFEKKRLPQKLAYAIMKNMNVLSMEAEIYNQELTKLNHHFETENMVELDDANNALFLENGMPKIKEEYQEEYSKDLMELLNFEVEVDLMTVSESLLDYEDKKYDSLSISDMRYIMRMVLDEKDS